LRFAKLRGERHVLAQLIAAGPEVAAVAGEPGAKLEEASVVDHAVLLQAIGDLREARALRDRYAHGRAIVVALERLEQRDEEPADPEQDQYEHGEGDQAAGPAPAACGAAMPRAPPAAAIAAVRKAAGLAEPVAAMPVGLRRHGLRLAHGRWLGLGRALARGLCRHRRAGGRKWLGVQRLGAGRSLHGRRLRRRPALARGSARLALPARGLPLLGRTAARIGRRGGAHSGAPARLRAR
jgi:hypothetical protein